MSEKLNGPLPAPVKRYFKECLPQADTFAAVVELKQEGRLRIGVDSDKWSQFSASQRIAVFPPAFKWKAKIEVFPLLSVTVEDEYKRGVGSGKVKFGRLNLVSEKDRPELNQAALHRYLAEAAWCPPALLPRHGLAWTPIDDSKALATLSDSGVSVDLEFAFRPSGGIASIYSPGRWMKLKGGYKKAPWKGLFSDPFIVDGMRLPRRGEVFWQINGLWESVWKGEVLEANFEQF